MDPGEYTIDVNDDQRIVHVVARGIFYPPLGDEMIIKSLNTAADHGYPILCDARESVAKVSLFDWFFLPRRLWVYRHARTRNIRTAIVVTAGEQESIYRFFETVTTNLGLNIRIFLDEAIAKHWLLQQGRATPSPPT